MVSLSSSDNVTLSRFLVIRTGLDHGVSLSSDNVLSLFLVIEQGKVLKVLHTIEDAFIISQYSLFHNEGPVLSMAIDSKKGHLYVGTAMEVQRIPLADCGRYGDSCRECILSRDPYCGWDAARRRCTPIPAGYNISTGALTQSLDHSNASICGEAAGECHSASSLTLYLH
ncbi:unnamed protein product [Oncorhynchus mykiss]|uniref:Semaphorin-1A n=1 Tax=Oncorhynchus mykiss TaxID=8022 RepID=A0A061A7D7_ONCMY|nr:unnamed protein product [Oncorhynchus mykiss]